MSGPGFTWEVQCSPERKVGFSRLKGKKEATLGRENSVKILEMGKKKAQSVCGTLGFECGGSFYMS